jgi:sigma-B regulation protein RsbU (phosphoserine phosphatase)
MTSPSITALPVINHPVETILRRIHHALELIGTLNGISVFVETPDGATFKAVDDGECISAHRSVQTEPLPLQGSTFQFALDDGVQVCVRGESGRPVTAELVCAVLRGSLQAMESEKREELLLEEVEANWESLEALYEISTEALRFGDIKDALRRLVTRLTTFQDGLHSALFIQRDGLFHSLVSTDPGAKPMRWAELGLVEKAVRDMQVVLVNQLDCNNADSACWRNGTSLAAAPFAWQGCIGFVVVWSEDIRCEFNSSFSRVLEAITYQASVMMEGDRLHRKVRDSELLAQEIEIASSIQQTLLLANAPKDVPDFEIAAFSLPSKQIDGDFHDFFQHPDGTLDVLIGDVMGKGVAAALLGAATKSQFLRATANLALQSNCEAPRPAAIVARAASRLSDRLIMLDRFVTLCYARFDATAGTVTFVDCGHTSMIRETKSRSDCEFFPGVDLPLGVLPNYQCEEQVIDLMPGQTYLLYSDGVTESRSPEGEMFGPERLAECVENWSSLGPPLLVQQIRKEAERFTKADRFSDDFTCIALRARLKRDNVKPVESRSLTFECTPQSLSSFRSWLRECAALVPDGFPEEDVARLHLACSEVFTNCIFHANDATSARPLSAEATVFCDHVTVRMSQRGPSFDPLTVPPPDFDGSREGGFGVYIVLRSSDETSFLRLNDEINVTTLSFLRRRGDRH